MALSCVARAWVPTAVVLAPKALAPIAGKPFLFYLFRQLSSSGVSSVILSTGYRADQIEAACGSSCENLKISYSREIEPLGTAGAIRLAVGENDAPQFMVLNGDSYCEFELKNFLEFHLSNRGEISILLTKVDDTSRYGRIETDANGAVKSFIEKSSAGAGSRQGPGWINAGVYLLSKAVIDSIPESRPVSLEREIFPRWIGRNMFGFKNSGGSFIDIGTPESFAAAQQLFSGKSTDIEYKSQR